MMATVKQLTLIPNLDMEKRSCASRTFANAQRQNIAGQDDGAALVLAAKSGEGHPFEILIERYQRRMLAVARRFARIRGDAEDIVEQSFQKAFVHLRKFEGKSSFSTWVTRIAINEALMWLRRGRGLREVSIDYLSGNEESAVRLEMPDSRACPESAFLQDERSRILSEAMDKLTLRTRTVIELRELGELSTREAAEIMGLSVGSVKARVFQGRKKLRQVLKCECIAIQASKQWGNLPYLLISSEPVTPDSKWLDTLSSDGHPHPHSNGRVSRPSTLYAARYQCFASPLGPRPKWQSACIPAKECN